VGTARVSAKQNQHLLLLATTALAAVYATGQILRRKRSVSSPTHLPDIRYMLRMILTPVRGAAAHVRPEESIFALFSGGSPRLSTLRRRHYLDQDLTLCLSDSAPHCRTQSGLVPEYSILAMLPKKRRACTALNPLRISPGCSRAIFSGITPESARLHAIRPSTFSLLSHYIHTIVSAAIGRRASQLFYW
jgi:hypothetical protein